MAERIDDTCDPSIRSWVESARHRTDFPLQNLPFGIARAAGSSDAWHVGVAIGTQVLDLTACAEAGLLDVSAESHTALRQPNLNQLVSLGHTGVGAIRRAVHTLLRDDAAHVDRSRVARHLFEMGEVEHTRPVAVANFTDFFASIHHATNVARLRNPDATLPFNYTHAPLAYHGRASTVVVSDTPVERPAGPRRGGDGAVYAPTERLDFEAEVGLVIGVPSTRGLPVPVRDARTHIAGVCLLNDWSARDIQSFEAQPLGPFLSKSFLTSLSPWLVTVHALEPFRTPARPRTLAEGPALPHLIDSDDQSSGAWNITVESAITSRTMREMDMAPLRLSASNLSALFWTPSQLVAHQTSNGSNLETGDLLGTGTMSGPAPDSRACLLEVTRGGREPLTLPTGETRAYLQDGDEVTLRAYCAAPGAARIGFGDCRGRVIPARSL